MKIKVITLFCIICMFAGVFMGCGSANIVEHTSNTTELTFATTEPIFATSPIPPQFYDFNEFVDAVKNENKDIEDFTKNITALYFPEIKLEGYALGVVNVYDDALTYCFVPSEFAGESWFEAKDADECNFTVYYTVDTDLKNMAANFVGGVEWLDDETFYHKRTRTTIVFKYENKICTVVLPKTYEGDIDLAQILEMQTVTIGE